ncbi:MAG: DUF1795 domain-containing protein [Sphingobacteriales bacterium]|nr:MAG: DUF1795 domain-containing protein [Sphingobacteriales bacterium]
MKFLILLLFPVFSFSQAKLDTVSFLSGKVKILAPKALKPMSDEMWTLKYQNRPRPVLVLSDNDGEVNLIADMTQQPARENQLVSFKDFQIQQLKSRRPDLQLLSDSVQTINGKKVGYFKFLTQAIDQKVFNYYFFTLVDGKILLLTFNCIEKLQKKWESTADQIVASLRTN